MLVHASTNIYVICHMIKLSTGPFIVYVLLYIKHCLIMNHKKSNFDTRSVFPKWITTLRFKLCQWCPGYSGWFLLDKCINGGVAQWHHLSPMYRFCVSHPGRTVNGATNSTSIDHLISDGCCRRQSYVSKRNLHTLITCTGNICMRDSPLPISGRRTIPFIYLFISIRYANQYAELYLTTMWYFATKRPYISAVNKCPI